MLELVVNHLSGPKPVSQGVVLTVQCISVRRRQNQNITYDKHMYVSFTLLREQCNCTVLALKRLELRYSNFADGGLSQSPCRAHQ